MRTKHFICFFAFAVCIRFASAQDSLATVKEQDSSIVLAKDSVRKIIFQPDAKRAGLLSALMPGMGQVYNRQYWKVPIVYAVMGTAIYFIVHNNNEYNRYRKAYVSRLANPNSVDEFTGILNINGIKQYQDEAKKNMDLMTVLTVVVYAGQIMEAISGAHLRNFDISKDLTMQIRPVITPINTFGVGLVMNFKR
ncbi:MAG: DUF5683 domain-containing protein [Phycisphaerales bacterium]|nr:DUF5683 domain-containing protein [Phycisphaerales bacterium]